MTTPVVKKNDFEVGGRKSSWLPLVAAVFGPVLVIVGIYALAFSYNNSRPEVFGPPAPALIRDAYFVIRLVDSNGNPAPQRTVTFRQEFPKNASVMQISPDQFEESTTDSDGIATVALKKTGNVIITVEGSDVERVVSNLERERNDQIEVRIRL